MRKDATHNLEFYSGERQTSSDYRSIRADHRFRYEWAGEIISGRKFGLDVFCGNGYGTWYLSGTRYVLGIDGSAEAIDFANKNFRRSSNLFSFAYYPFELPKEAFDFVIALESIEHVAEGGELLDRLSASLKLGGDLIFSTPCEDRLPLSATGNHFHFRHYTLDETLKMANSNGMRLEVFAGQDVYELTPEGLQGDLLPDEGMKLRIGVPGQFIIVHSKKIKNICKQGLASKFIPVSLQKILTSVGR